MLPWTVPAFLASSRKRQQWTSCHVMLMSYSSHPKVCTETECPVAGYFLFRRYQKWQADKKQTEYITKVVPLTATATLELTGAAANMSAAPLAPICPLPSILVGCTDALCHIDQG